MQAAAGAAEAGADRENFGDLSRTSAPNRQSFGLGLGLGLGPGLMANVGAMVDAPVAAPEAEAEIARDAEKRLRMIMICVAYWHSGGPKDSAER